MNKKSIALILLLSVLAGCASIPTEYTSPCACDYRPLNQQIEEDGKVAT